MRLSASARQQNISSADSNASAPKSIPGFYWDQTKSRYFKIAHTASGGQYTASALAKRRRLEDEKDLAEATRNGRAPPSRRSKRFSSKEVYASTQTCALIHGRTLGLSLTSQKEFTWAKQLRMQNDQSVDILSVSPEKRSILAYDPETDNLYFASHKRVCATELTLSATVNRSRLLTMPICPLRSSASSLVYHARQRFLMATATGGANAPAEIYFGEEAGGRIATIDETLWCSAIHHDHAHVVAAGSVALLYDYAVGESSRQMINIPKKTHIWSTDFLDTHVAAFGCRSGEVYLSDIRASPALSPRFLHGVGSNVNAGVTKLKAMSPYQLMVSGLRSTLALYDTRFLKHGRALVVYSGHTNTYQQELSAMAIVGQVVAVAASGGGINLWHLNGEYYAHKTTDSEVNDLLLYSADDGRQKLWAATRTSVQQWEVDCRTSLANG